MRIPCDFGDKHKGKLIRIWLVAWEQWANVCPACEKKILADRKQQADAATAEWNSPIELPAETFDDLPLFGGPLQPETFADPVRQA